ncbi:MAG: ankyrin repeat domain-containing protein [Endozoicomonadaceae bacterium]|nr:ankyrin repeat domain-containing protein [Endozoicomonadaceae bacterium]
MSRKLTHAIKCNFPLSEIKALFESGETIANNDLLFEPIHYNNIELCKWMLENGANASFRKDNGSSPLGLCLHFNKVNFIRLFVDAGASVKDHNFLALVQAAQGEEYGLFEYYYNFLNVSDKHNCLVHTLKMSIETSNLDVFNFCQKFTTSKNVVSDELLNLALDAYCQQGKRAEDIFNFLSVAAPDTKWQLSQYVLYRAIVNENQHAIDFIIRNDAKLTENLNTAAVDIFSTIIAKSEHPYPIYKYCIDKGIELGDNIAFNNAIVCIRKDDSRMFSFISEQLTNKSKSSDFVTTIIDCKSHSCLNWAIDHFKPVNFGLSELKKAAIGEDSYAVEIIYDCFDESQKLDLTERMCNSVSSVTKDIIQNVLLAKEMQNLLVVEHEQSTSDSCNLVLHNNL